MNWGVGRQMMKWIVTGMLVFLGALVLFILLYRWDRGQNRGYSHGYWGELNRVSNALVRIPGLNIVNSGCNADMTMEEFGFDVRTAEGKNLHLWFLEDDPTRNLSGTRLSDAVTKRINKESSNQASQTIGAEAAPQSER